MLLQLLIQIFSNWWSRKMSEYLLLDGYETSLSQVIVLDYYVAGLWYPYCTSWIDDDKLANALLYISVGYRYHPVQHIDDHNAIKYFKTIGSL